MGGRLIVFEGIEGSGKSTQAKLFCEALLRRGEKCVYTTEPTDSEIGKLIRELLKAGNKTDLRTLQLLFIADRSKHVEELIIPKMNEGYTVVTDRYAPSTIAYGSSFGAHLGLTIDYIIDAHKPFIVPDILFYMRVSPQVASDRINKRKGILERFDDKGSLDALYKAYEDMSKSYIPSKWREINAWKESEAVAAEVMEIYDKFCRGN